MYSSYLKPWEEKIRELKEDKMGTYAIKWAVWCDEFDNSDVEKFPYQMATSRALKLLEYGEPKKVFSSEKEKDDFLNDMTNFAVFECNSVWFKIWIAVPVIFRLEDLSYKTRKQFEMCPEYCPLDLAESIPTWAAEFNRKNFIVNDK